MTNPNNKKRKAHGIFPVRRVRADLRATAQRPRTIIDKAAAHCVANKIEEAALLSDRLYLDMFCLARQIRQAADFGRNTPGRLAGVAGSEFTAVDDTSFTEAKKRIEESPAFVKSLTRAQVEGTEDKDVVWSVGGNDRKMKGAAYLQQFGLPNFFLCHDSLLHPAPSWRTARQTGLYGFGLHGLT